MRYLILLCGFLCVTPAASADERPNIVFMLADDQSWDGTSVAMHPDVTVSKNALIQTPNLERFATQGMRFSAAYAPAPMCAPTRCSLQLGMGPAATGWTKPGHAARASAGYRLVPPQTLRTLDPATTTVAELLRSAGYATAHFGKWHLQGGGPEQHGYDVSDGNIGNEAADRFKDPNPADIFGMASRTEEFMAASQRAGKPFFVQLSWLALHGPQGATRANVEKYRRLGARSPERSALAEDLDAGAGRVIDAVDRLGLGRNTYVIYYSDNGGGGVLTGGKGSLYEGGIRMPLIVRGPGVAAGSWCHVPVTGVDFFPTFCEWAGVPTARLPSRLEGGSIASLLTDNGQGEVDRAREGLLFHFPHYQGRNTPHSALILDGMKGLYDYENSRFRLFDLTADLGEQRDLASARPAEAALMQGLLEQYLREDGAGLPVMNSQYDPVKAAASAQSRGPRSRTEGRTRPGQGPGPERRRGRPGRRQG